MTEGSEVSQLPLFERLRRNSTRVRVSDALGREQPLVTSSLRRSSQRLSHSKRRLCISISLYETKTNSPAF